MDTSKLMLLLLLIGVSVSNEFANVFGAGMCIEQERRALVRFGRNLEYDVFYLWGGEENNEDCCRWKGVECSNTTNHVISLQLNCLELGYRTNEINPLGNFSGAWSGLIDLHHLKVLDLSGCSFDENPIPSSIASFQKLEHLVLNFCHISGVIPWQLQNLTKLKTLDLGLNNFLEANNLDWLYHLPFLSRLDLSGNKVGDPNWLQAISSLPSLKELDLSDCGLPQLTPSSLHFSINSSFPSLSKVDLAGNYFNLSILSWLVNFSSSLVSLDLSFINLEGSHIPTEIGNFILLEHLDMSHNNLNGKVPEFLNNLRNLRFLDLSYNQLVGSLPNLSGLFSLTELHLTENNLTGSLAADAHIGQLSELEILDVSSNMLNGIITESDLSNLHNLRVIDLSFNSLQLVIPANWIPPFQLQKLKLAGCRVGTQFPKWIQTQNNISHLDLSSTGIFGPVSDYWLSSMPPNLYYLNLSHNQFSGNFPDLSSINVKHLIVDISFNEFSGSLPSFHPNTTVLKLSRNLFTGPISSICTYVSIGLIDLSSNHLSGELPPCLTNMSSLNALDLSNNYISGNIREDLASNLFLMEALVLRNNNLSGELPLFSNGLSSLTILDVGGNHLTGTIPRGMGMNLTGLEVLSLRDNNFHGMIPPEICHLTEIRILDLSGNDIQGRIPKCISNFTSLAQYDRDPEVLLGVGGTGDNDGYVYSTDYYTENIFLNWKRKGTEYRRNAMFLKLIDLSNNKLVGNIPKELSILSGLVSLNLSINQLTGSIDPNIGQLQHLESLDLSGNLLSGEIPTGLAQLTFLSVLDLSNNNLSGSIPLSTQLQGFDASVYAGNNGLCGLPLAPCPILDNPHPSLTVVQKHDYLDKEFYICAASGFVLGFWGIIILVFFTSSWRNALYKF